VQVVPKGQRNTPLVLIHDGGGTTFGYFILGNLRRDVWALHNPYYSTSATWEGGMDEMARHYVGLLEKAGIRGDIFLGGWSLGGLLSVTIARLLACDATSCITVSGLVLMDSPFHIPWSKLQSVSVSEPSFTKFPELVQKSLEQCHQLLDTWELPTWEGPACNGQEVYVAVDEREFCLLPGQVLYKPLKEEWVVREARVFEYEMNSDTDTDSESGHRTALNCPPVAPPPGIIMRCIKRSATRDISETKPCRVDLYREKEMLGWDGNYPDFIKAVIDVDSDHFGMFGFDKIEELTNLLNECLGVLDTLEVDDL